MGMRTMGLIAFGLASLVLLSGCGSKSYVVESDDHRSRGAAAWGDEFDGVFDGASEAEDSDLRFPASIGIVHVRREWSRRHDEWDGVRFRVLRPTDRSPQPLELPTDLEGCSNVVTLNSLVLPSRMLSAEELRGAAADLGLDVLVLYSVDTRMRSFSNAPFLGFITLGLAPVRQARSHTIASALFMDQASGDILGFAEGEGRSKRFSNGWGSSRSERNSVKRAERRALDDLSASAQRTWTGIVTRNAQSEAF